jgi:hypothetical protein
LKQKYDVWKRYVLATDILKTTEPLTSASSCVSEADIRKWFDEVKEYIKEKKL